MHKKIRRDKSDEIPCSSLFLKINQRKTSNELKSGKEVIEIHYRRNLAHHEHFCRQNMVLKIMHKNTRYSISNMSCFKFSEIVDNKLLSSCFQYDTKM